MPRKFHVEVSATAQKDIARFFEQISGDAPGAAAKWLARIEAKIESLEVFPFRCPRIPEKLSPEYRHHILGNYRTIFRVTGTTVWVVRVIHGAQLLDPSSLEGAP